MKRIFVYKPTIFFFYYFYYYYYYYHYHFVGARVSKTFFLRFIKQIYIYIYIRFPNTV